MLVHVEFVDELASGWNRVHRDPRNTVHLDGHLQTVPVDRRHLGEAVLEYDANSVPLVDFDGGAGDTTVIAPGVDNASRHELRSNHFGNQVELFDAVDHLPRKLGKIGGPKRVTLDVRGPLPLGCLTGVV